jgi:pilus assembly protein CpaE
MTVVVAPNEQATARFQITLGGKLVAVKTGRELDDHLQRNRNEKLVVIAPEIEQAAAFEIAAKLAGTQVGVILVRQRLEVSTLTKAMQLGVREVIAADDAAELLAAVGRFNSASSDGQATPTHETKAKTALIFAAKGGVGKTTLALNLAEALALEGDKSVCLVDLDLQFGDVAVALQLEPTKNISAAVRMKGNLDDAGVRSMLVQYRPNLHVLLAPMEPAEVEFISAEIVENVLRSLQSQFDYVVIDSPPAITDFILKAFDLADDYLLMTTMDVTSVKNLKVTLETLNAIGMPEHKRHIVVNRSTAKSGLSLSDVQKMIGIPVLASIPESNLFPSALNRGKTVVGEHQRHAISKTIIAIGRALRGAEAEAQSRGWFGRGKS